jgi:hypothetical protein
MRSSWERTESKRRIVAPNRLTHQAQLYSIWMVNGEEHMAKHTLKLRNLRCASSIESTSTVGSEKAVVNERNPAAWIMACPLKDMMPAVMPRPFPWTGCQPLQTVVEASMLELRKKTMGGSRSRNFQFWPWLWWSCCGASANWWLELELWLHSPRKAQATEVLTAP